MKKKTKKRKPPSIEAGPKVKAQGISSVDVDRLIRVADNPEDRLLIIIMWATALPLARLRELRVADLDLDGDLVRIKEKNWVPLSHSAAQWIRGYLLARSASQRNLLLSSSSTPPARPAFERRVQRTLSALGIKALKRRVSAFEIRTGRIRDLVAQGMTPRNLVHFLGIDDPRTVGQYCLAFYSPDDSADERQIRDLVEIDLPDSPQVDTEASPIQQESTKARSRRRR